MKNATYVTTGLVMTTITDKSEEKGFHLAMKHDFHSLYQSHLTKEQKIGCDHSSTLREKCYPSFVHS